MSSERKKQRRLTEEEIREKRQRNEDLFYLTQVKIVEKLREKGQRSLIITDNEFGQLRIRRNGSWVLDLKTIGTEMNPNDMKKKKRSMYDFVLENHTLLTEYQTVVKIVGEPENLWEGSLRRYIELNTIELSGTLLKNMHRALMRLNDPRSSKATLSRSLVSQ